MRYERWTWPINSFGFVVSSQPQSHPKIPKMKIFQLTQRNFATIGISADSSTQSSYRFNGRIFVGVFILGSIAICNFIYIFYEAETSAEYTESIFMSTLSIPFFLALLILILNVKKLFELINNCENLVNTSEWRKSNSFLKNVIAIERNYFNHYNSLF